MIYKKETKEFVDGNWAMYKTIHYLFNIPIIQNIQYTTNVNIKKSLGVISNNKTTIKGFN